MKSQIMLVLFAISAVFGALLPAVQLHAAEGGSHHYSGTSCQPVPMTSSLTYGTLTYNGSTARTLDVVCPLNFHQYSDDGESALVKVVVRDSHPSAGQDILCTLYATDSVGSVYSYTSVSSSSSSMEPMTLQFAATVEDAFYYLKCTLPPVYNGAGSGIYTYRLIEN